MLFLNRKKWSKQMLQSLLWKTTVNSVMYCYYCWGSAALLVLSLKIKTSGLFVCLFIPFVCFCTWFGFFFLIIFRCSGDCEKNLKVDVLGKAEYVCLSVTCK